MYIVHVYKPPVHCNVQMYKNIIIYDKIHDAVCVLPANADLLHSISQMPVVLIPIHFDRSPEDRPTVPSCQRSIVLRTFITADFMTGIPATPGQEIPVHVSATHVQCASH